MDAGLRISLSNEKLINIGEALELSLSKNEQEENSILKNSASDLIRKFFHIAEVSSLDIIYYEQPCLRQARLRKKKNEGKSQWSHRSKMKC